MTRERLPEAPGPTWAWSLLFAAIVAAMAYLRLVVYPDRFVPLAYGLPLLLFIWRRDLRLLWATTAALAVILASKWYTLARSNPVDSPETLFFFVMQLAGLLVPALAVHYLIAQTRRLECATAALQEAYAELEATNEELAARDEEISQQNEDLQSQASELEQQAEELASQTEELQATNDQLLARERTLDEIISLSAAGAGEDAILTNLGTMVARLFAPRAVGAAIVEPRGGHAAIHPLFGLAMPTPVVPEAATVAALVTEADTAAYVADLAERPDLAVPVLANGERPQSVIAAPARVDGATSIALEVYTHVAGEWSELDLQLVQWSAEQCGRLWTTTRLRQDLARLADSERAARMQAERSARDKDEFVATLAHELRTPVGAVLGWASLLRTIAKSPEELEKGLEVIERNARQQSRLIADLLDMSRAVGGKLLVDHQPVNLSEVVDAAIDEQCHVAQGRGITITRVDDVTPMVLGDAGRLQQVLGNVLANALKFTARGGSVRVEVWCDETMAHVTLTDTGKGIRPDLIPALFDRYRQADSSSSRSHGGLGLGLAIARHILDLHGGLIALRSDGEGQGTTCVVSLPLLATVNGRGAVVGAAPDAPAVVDHELGARRALTGLPVLVVDDDEDTLEFVSRLLEEYGARVSRARRGPEALSLLDEVHPRLLVSDIGMPEMDGYELMRRVRQHAQDGTRAIPAIAITAFSRPDDMTRALEAGFQFHVSKPIDPTALLAAVTRVVSGSADLIDA